MSRYWRTENEDGTFTNEKCYTAKDMEDFAEWIGRNAFPCDSKEWWTINETGEEVTTTELREIWEQSRKEEAE